MEWKNARNIEDRQQKDEPAFALNPRQRTGAKYKDVEKMMAIVGSNTSSNKNLGKV